jgi:hypothetical protein
MNKERQIEEMTKITCQMYRRDQEKKCAGVQECDMKCLQYQRCEALYNMGYHRFEWISVEDRLPAKFTKVLCFYPSKKYGSNIVVDYMESDDGSFAEQFRHGAPTHWIPLPVPPTEKEN